ncbi:MAG: universal stress protein [Myxococcales bacterium]|nr:universal stress protein [Myxococcales bacterium]
MDFSDLNDSLGQFESALSGEKVTLESPAPKTILLALDGSNQDATALALAGELARRFKARVVVTRGCEGEAPEAVREQVEAAKGELAAQPYGVDSAVIFKSAPLPAQQILAAQQKLGADLVVIPAPYLRDVGLLGDESLSSPIDMLLAECTAPLLLVRHPLDAPKAALRRMLIPMTVNVPALGAAAGWAFKMVDPDGKVELYAVADEAAVEDARKLMGVDEELTADALLRAESKLAGGMTSAVQQKGTETGVTVVVDVAVGKALKLTLGRIHEAPCIVCTGTPLDRTTRAFNRVQNVTLGSKYPVLVVRR